MTEKICARCVLPAAFPGISFDDNGVCCFCAEAPSQEEYRINQEHLRKKMAHEIERLRGDGEYDVIVAFSGGKDSSYTLKILVEEYGLTALAVTIDNGFIAPQALANARAVTESLGTDFMLFTPNAGFMRNMYTQSAVHPEIHSRSAVKRASSMCNSCITLINNYMIKTALRHGCSMIAGGYIGGQIPKDSALLNLDLLVQEKIKSNTVERYKNYFGSQSSKYFAVHPELINEDNRKISILNPMLTLSITEDQIIESIADLGWVKPTNTGQNSSNCLLNDLGIAVHFQKHKFHPYIYEISESVRAGTMTREEALSKVSEIPSFDDQVDQIAALELDVSQI
ncbi:hypothetical protein N9359_04230 [Luminiphilus sp.]|nr:hypothetical protein [Luminiphilus sp.]